MSLKAGRVGVRPDQVDAQGFILAGCGSELLSGADVPDAETGKNGNLYLQTQNYAAYCEENKTASGDVDSGLGWYSALGAVCKNTNAVGSIQGRNYMKTTNDPALVWFSPSAAGTYQARYASTVADGTKNKSSYDSSVDSYDYTYEVAGKTWYVAMGQHGFQVQASAVTTTYPKLTKVYALDTKAGFESLLEDLGVFYTDKAETDVVKKAYCKVSDSWQDLIGTNIENVEK